MEDELDFLIEILNKKNFESKDSQRNIIAFLKPIEKVEMPKLERYKDKQEDYELETLSNYSKTDKTDKTDKFNTFALPKITNITTMMNEKYINDEQISNKNINMSKKSSVQSYKSKEDRDDETLMVTSVLVSQYSNNASKYDMQEKIM